MPVYELHFDYCALVVFLFTLYIFLRKKNTYGLQNKFFLLLVIDGLLATLADICSAFMISDGVAGPRLLLDLCNYVYMLLQFAAPLLFCFYFMIVTGIHKRHSRLFFILFSMPFGLDVLALILNPFTGLVFHHTSQTLYVRGVLILPMTLMAGLYVVAVLYFALRYRRNIPHSQIPALIAFFVLCVGAMAYQCMNQYELIELFAQSVVSLFILITIENEADVINGSTGVNNRRTFILRNQYLLKSKISYDVLIIKFLNEKHYESVLGVSFMQDVLRSVMRFLSDVCGDMHCIYDCENGNFAVLLEEGDGKDIQQITEAVHDKFSQDWIFRDMSIAFRTLLSVVRVPDAISSLEDMLVLVDSLEEKLDSRVMIVKEDHLRFLQRRNAVENAIQKALQNNTLQVYYQPIWDSRTNKIHSAEALVRLLDDTMGFIPPDEFIPIAEKNGMIADIGKFVFDDVCRLLSRERLADIGINFIEVNLSTVQCMHRNLADAFKRTLEQYGLASNTINLEITESAAINSFEAFSQTMQELRNIGFAFSLDDYGTDHAEASYIFNMDFNIIKIDKSILWQAEKKASAKIFLRNTIRMIKEMNLKIVVEGVETEQQKNMIASLGCDYCQGYYFSRPLPKEQFIAYCREFNLGHI